MAATLTYAECVKGFSINQLAELFEMDRRTATDRLRNVEPSDNRGGHPIYRMLDAAPALLEINTTVKSKMAAAREKDYWDAQLKKQKFEENAGDLWRTDKVIEVFASVFKQFRESVVVFIDGLEHESGLPPKTIAAAKGFGDALLHECRAKLVSMDTNENLLTDEESESYDEEQNKLFAEMGLF